MNGDIVGFAAVVMSLGLPMAALYTFYRVRKLRTEERMAAIARGANMPMEPELSHQARSRRNGVLLVSAALGYIVTFALVARVDSDAWVAAAFGAIPLSLGIGFFVDAALLHRDASAA